MTALWEVTHEGKQYQIVTEPIAENYKAGIVYRAWGTDNDGNDVIVYWNTTDEWDEKMSGELYGNPDESEACDWDSPCAVVWY